MSHVHLVIRIAQAGAVLLLACSAPARASDCAGGMDATGNACNGAEATRSIGAPDANRLYLKGAAMMAELRAVQARQRQSEADAEVKQTEASLKAAQKALSDAERAAQR